MEEIKQGDIITGKVIGIQPYGAFIQIGEDITGLVHISEISSSFVKDINKYLSLNEEYSFYVLEYNAENKHAKLSLKKITEDKENKRKARIKEKKNKLNEYLSFFDLAYETVLNGLNQIDNKEIIKENIDKIEKEIYMSLPLSYSLELMEKDINDIIDFSKGFSLNNVVFVANKEKISLIRAFIELYCYKEKINVIYIDEDKDYKDIVSAISYLSNKDYLTIFDTSKNLDKRQALIYRLLRKNLEDHNLDTSNKFIFISKEESLELSRLSAKENYKFFVDRNIEDKYGVLSLSTLLLLALNTINISDVILGYKKALIDIDNDKTIISSLLSLDNKEISNNHFLDEYLNILNINIKIGLDNGELVVPVYKDFASSIKNDYKDIKEIIKEDEYDLLIHDNSAYSLGYLFCILISTSINK